MYSEEYSKEMRPDIVLLHDAFINLTEKLTKCGYPVISKINLGNDLCMLLDEYLRETNPEYKEGNGIFYRTGISIIEIIS
jgi:hypothetical protein